MTTDELRACAIQAEAALLRHGDPLSGDDWSTMRVVRAYLADHPADDAELVTEEWLQSIGFIRACFEDRCFGYHHKKRCHTLNLRTDRGSVSNIDVFTRGDVRRLLTALGIPLAPKG